MRPGTYTAKRIVSFIINIQNHYLMIPRCTRIIGMGRVAREARGTPYHCSLRVDQPDAAAMQPSAISVAGEPETDACLTPTHRVKNLNAGFFLKQKILPTKILKSLKRPKIQNSKKNKKKFIDHFWLSKFRK